MNSETIVTPVYSCQRCGWDHRDLHFEPLVHPADEWTHWAPCPVTGQPVLLAPTGGAAIKKPTTEAPVKAYLFAAKGEEWKVGAKVRIQSFQPACAGDFVVLAGPNALGSVELASAGNWFWPHSERPPKQLWAELSPPFNRFADVQLVLDCTTVGGGS